MSPARGIVIVTGFNNRIGDAVMRRLSQWHGPVIEPYGSV